MSKENDEVLGPSPLQGLVSQAVTQAQLDRAARRFFQAGAISPLPHHVLTTEERESALETVRGLMCGYDPMHINYLPNRTEPACLGIHLSEDEKQLVARVKAGEFDSLKPVKAYFGSFPS